MNNLLNSLLLHPSTLLQLKQFLQDPTHALAITGTEGSGKKTLAEVIALILLDLPAKDKLNSYPYFFTVAQLKNKSDISIEQVREIINSLKLKVPGNKKIKRIVLIEDAQFLSIPAQNALLKILEETNLDTVFILSINSMQNVLPTIASRVQELKVQPISLKDALVFWPQDQFAKEAVEGAWRLSGGAVGLMHALLTENTDHALKMAVDEAKVFLKSTKYQRLLFVDRLSKSKDNFQLFLAALARTLTFLHHSAIKNNREVQSKNILLSRKAIRQSSEALEMNANSKLVALKLVLNLKV
jgi:DNA polymerase-3 subunit delta'